MLRSVGRDQWIARVHSRKEREPGEGSASRIVKGMDSWLGWSVVLGGKVWKKVETDLFEALGDEGAGNTGADD